MARTRLGGLKAEALDALGVTAELTLTLTLTRTRTRTRILTLTLLGVTAELAATLGLNAEEASPVAAKGLAAVRRRPARKAAPPNYLAVP
eukprot:scaffold19588_cov24-Phaeocystis_antarctica.AAC.1